ncbi:MAG: M20/M25/M40 family metallo-hydrolase [Methanobacteriota archaeon]|nr:MAG: M20/M25/M40 family metallo-hydrolase [Euryarchaeota archaeon]
MPGYPPNIVARRTVSRDAPTIILNGHLDTIEPLSSWKDDPFTPRLKGNMLHGLGASDMKGGLAVLINAFKRVRNDRINLVFSATVDEEGESTGAHAFVQKYGGDFCLVGEPSRERIMLGGRGRFLLELTARGRAAQGARPHLGKNAIEDMAKVVDSLGKIKIRKHNLLGEGSITPLGIEGGKESLTVPEMCKLKVDRHTVAGETRDVIKRDFEKVVCKLNIGSSIYVTFAERGTPFLKPYIIDRRNKYVRSFIRFFRSKYRREPVIAYAKSVGDYNVFGCRMPTVVFGPIGRDSHTSRERVDIRSLYGCERFLTDYLESL